MSIELLTFSEVVNLSQSYPKRHLLLGNGFSIACRPNIFIYGKLFEQADFSSLSRFTKNVFTALNTTDFERVIQVLNDTVKLSSVYGIDQILVNQMKDDVDALKELLVRTIAKSHPEKPMDIKDEEYLACQNFLKYFHTIYTFNYDLLLYWTIMNSDTNKIDDGFRSSDSEYQSSEKLEYVTWETGQSNKQNIWFLHSALHIFDSGTEIKKYTWNRTGICLIEQIRNSLANDLFPLFVSEGSSLEKLNKIRHSDYLSRAYRSFQAIGNCLFVHGHSLAENDEHYLKLIERGKVKHLFLGLHGDPDTENNKRIIRRANLMVSNRRNSNALKLSFYDTETANVWRS
jgi:hypothetical protein